MSKEQQVKVGQVWEINQRRYYRRAEVISIDDERALMMPEDGLASQVTFKGLKERWKLIKDVP